MTRPRATDSEAQSPAILNALCAKAQELPRDAEARLLLDGIVADAEGRAGDARALYLRAINAPDRTVRAEAALRLAEHAATHDGNSLGSLAAQEHLCRDLGAEGSVDPNDLGRVRGLLLMRMAELEPGRAVLFLQQARDALEPAIGEAAQLLRASSPRAVAQIAEDHGHHLLALVRCLFALERQGVPGGAAARGWALFRTWRALADSRSERAGECEGESGALLEFVLPPHGGVHVSVTTGRGEETGALHTSVLEASIVQKQFQDALWSLRPAGAARVSATQLAGMCRVSLAAVEAWSEILLRRQVDWSDSAPSTLGSRLAALGAEHLTIIPHGPTQGVPWAFLRETDASAKPMDRCSTVIAPTRKRCAQYVRRVGDDTLSDGRGATQFERLVTGMKTARVALAAGHGLFRHENPLESLLDLTVSDIGPVRLPLEEMLFSRVEFGPPFSVVLAACEATEVHRHRCITDFIHSAYAFLAAGASQVLAPSWTISELADPLLERIRTRVLTNTDGGLAVATRTEVASIAEEWRRRLKIRDVEAVVDKDCLRDGLVPICDAMAINVWQSI